MTKYLFPGWLIVLAAMFWFDRRQSPTLLSHDVAATFEAAAGQSAQREDWDAAAADYGKMLGALPDDPAHQTVRLQLVLAIQSAGARMGRQFESMKLLDDALQRFDGVPAVAPVVLHDVRRELGLLHYYNAWLMRLQGAPASLWTGEAERARQHFRYLAGADNPGTARETDAENIERVIRLERLDISELRGRKLPKFAEGMNKQPADQNLEDEKNKTKPKASDIARKVPSTDDLGRPGNAGFISNHSLTGS